MNIEELSKSQLILLTVLVNFVTSVATGILTVSLLDQAPAVVTQTINRVVDHTVETVTKVVPTSVGSPAPSNQDLVTGAIAAGAAHTVALYNVKTGTTTPALAVGAYLPSARAIVTASRDTLPKEVLIEFANKAYVPASLSHSGGGLAIYGFSDTATLPKATSPQLIPTKDLKLGQTVLAIGEDGSAATGIVSRVGNTEVRTTLPSLGAGSAAVDLSGNLIGIFANGTTHGLLISAEAISTLLTPPATNS
ncbi:hypothetical protein COU19_01980 [Candidatus Kaiserbacteria bacterium CG10_big_fil_rev_8_21_14_0_10_56_12]|uniref:Serine protease n=1 Tax=Candidatus Kaiserbacteria bacterium CG10_big_fil_rev_8_21_14_0_10_56_12 TaxID=1974611 RepID=A0A2H0U9R2_9BACT|nr:MAG: hypothetical protein COU19_01980 [Candidatus Kaiserbacteria bacterium CG10_big_fil_rev_8_21_14_0_10_56_12]